jgi:hypothetical protein
MNKLEELLTRTGKQAVKVTEDQSKFDILVAKSEGQSSIPRPEKTFVDLQTHASATSTASETADKTLMTQAQLQLALEHLKTLKIQLGEAFKHYFLKIGVPQTQENMKTVEARVQHELNELQLKKKQTLKRKAKTIKLKTFSMSLFQQKKKEKLARTPRAHYLNLRRPTGRLKQGKKFKHQRFSS